MLDMIRPQTTEAAMAPIECEVFQMLILVASSPGGIQVGSILAQGG